MGSERAERRQILNIYDTQILKPKYQFCCSGKKCSISHITALELLKALEAKSPLFLAIKNRNDKVVQTQIIVYNSKDIDY